MKAMTISSAALGAFLLLLPAMLAARELPDPSGTQALDHLKREMIMASLRTYPGRCPCPYNTMSNGASCGRRSAYSRPGGRSPLCYIEDIDTDMVWEWAQRQNRATPGRRQSQPTQ